MRTLSEARSEDEKHIQELERELRNCSQEIGSGAHLASISLYSLAYIINSFWMILTFD